MSKRNFVLLIIILIIALAMILGFFYFNKPASQTIPGSSGGTNFFAQFNPFSSGTKTTPSAPTPPTPTTPESNPTPEAPVKLQRVSSMPIAGFTVFSKERLKVIPVTTPADTTTPDNSTTQTPATIPVPLVKGTKGVSTKPVLPPNEFAPALRYVARATGNIYETFADNIAEQQLTTTVIPKVYDAYFGNGGQSVAMRYLLPDGKTIETFLGNLPKEVFNTTDGSTTTANSDLNGSLLPNNIQDISLSSDGKSMFYLFDSGDDIIGTTLNFLSNKKAQIFDSPFTEWLSSWPNSKMITLTTKPASVVPGYTYTLDPNTKNFTRMLGSINGLTTLASPDGKLVLYGDNNLALNIYNISTKTLTPLGLRTMPEKCVWNTGNDTIYCAAPKSIPGGQYPDDWYQGNVSFSDDLWEIDAKTGNTTLLADPSAIVGGEDIDGIELMLDPSENYLFFVNKKDSYLWEYNLK